MSAIERIDSIEIRPGVGTLDMFRFMSYTPWYAIGEFVDNSIASWQRMQKELYKVEGSDYVLQIAIKLEKEDGGLLKIVDNAGGIAAEDYKRAFKPAERPPDQTQLSRYGMGMKTAACWFSDLWSVTSTALGESVERTVTFDIPKIVKTGCERIEPTVTPAEPNDHRTVLVLRHLNSIPIKRTDTKIKDYLGQMYRRFIADGKVRIIWRDEEVTYKERATLFAPYHKEEEHGKKRRWEKEFELELPKGKPVQGRAKLFDKGEQNAAGLHLFWRGRLIKGCLEDRYRPTEIFGQGNSYRQQRLLVELNLDDFNPTVDKTDFIWGGKSATEADVLQALRKKLDEKPLPLLDQAENYRSTKLEKAARKAAEKAASATVEAIAEYGPDELEEQIARPPEKHDPLPPPSHVPPASMSSLEITVDHEKWRIVVEFTEQEVDRSDWLQITEKPKPQANGVRRLGIKVALNNPFALKFAAEPASMTLMVRLAAGIALAEVTARDAGCKNAGEVRRNLNQLLTNVLSQS